MKLTTPVAIPKSEFNLSHQEPILLLGSCFAHNIGEKLLGYKFDVTIYPNGIIYNPISLINGLKRVLNNQPYSESELNQHNKKWISFNHHGNFSSFEKEAHRDSIAMHLERLHLLDGLFSSSAAGAIFLIFVVKI